MPGGFGNIGEWTASLSQEQRIENARKAGQKSAEKQRKKRLMRDIISEMLLMDSFDPDVGAKLTALGLQPTNANALQLTAIAKAVSGDAEMLRFVRDTVGISAGMSCAQEEAARAVKSGYRTLYHYDPRKEDPFTPDSPAPTMAFEGFLAGETRYASLYKTYPEEAKKLFAQACSEAKQRYEKYMQMAKPQNKA